MEGKKGLGGWGWRESLGFGIWEVVRVVMREVGARSVR